ncbi:MAG: hypothetical protein IJJ33_13580 [Victivallales bacterium]|nr:hypothetical protein [Victivallales bacterium]
MHLGYQHMVFDDFVERLREVRAIRARTLESLHTRQDAEAYQGRIREVLAKAFATDQDVLPVNPRTLWKKQYEGYSVEGITFDLRPGYQGTANLYIPDGLKGPAPAVLFACGHAEDGKASTVYQQCCIRLVQNGFVVLSSDPVQQGERRQYDLIPVEERGQAAGLCGAHNVIDRQLRLLGESMPAWRVWDNRRALDVLLARPEVDKAHVGMTGNSGGGTLTEWTWANEPRLTMAAPSCHVTTFLTNLENELPTDAEQCPTGVLAAGLEMGDFLMLRAPQPVILLGQKYDFFERRGLVETYQETRRFYSLFGAEDKVELFIGPTTHGYSPHNQKAMVSFFLRMSGRNSTLAEVEPAPIPAKDTWVTPQGNVNQAGSAPVWKVIGQIAERAAASRKAPATEQEWRQAAGKLLKMPIRRGQPPHYRCLRCWMPEKEVFWSRAAIETERGIRAILHKRLVDVAEAQTLNVEEEITLFLPHFSSEEETVGFAPVAKREGALYMLDVRGIGETQQEEERAGGFFQPYGSDYMMNAFSSMFGESYFGRRVFDVLRSIDVLKAEGVKKIHLVGRGTGSLLALFAALFEPAVADLELHETPKTFREWIDNAVCDWPASSYPDKVLLAFDLPDLRDFYGARLTVKSWSDSLMQ